MLLLTFGLIGVFAFIQVYAVQAILPLLVRDFQASVVQAGSTVGATVLAVALTAPFTGNPYGIPDSVAIAACGTVAGCSPSAQWVFNQPVNTDGGDLTGFEVSYQQPFSFLPGFWSNFGLMANYTFVDSEIEYPGGITNSRWENLYGGDGFWVFSDPSDPDYVYAEYQGGNLARINRKTLAMSV